ncbi:Serine/arginine-rich splicing factor 3, partial [Trichinella pseudospiralis]
LVLLVYFIRIAYIMSYREQCPADCKVYVGGLPERASRGELEEIFGRFGPLRNVWVARRPWGFAFVEFEDARDAIDAVRQLDGSRMCGVRARVELSHGQRRNRGPRGYDDERRGGDRRSVASDFTHFQPTYYYTTPNCNEKLQSVKMRGRVCVSASTNTVRALQLPMPSSLLNCCVLCSALRDVGFSTSLPSRLIAAVLAFGFANSSPRPQRIHLNCSCHQLSFGRTPPRRSRSGSYRRSRSPSRKRYRSRS